MYNKLTLKILSIIIVLFTLMFQTTKTLSQNELINEIIIEMQKEQKIKQIKTGKNVRIWYNDEKFKGRIDSISPDKLFMNGMSFDIDKVEKIGIKFNGTIIGGSIVGATGLVISSIGSILIIKGLSSGDLGGVIAVVFGLVIDMIGIPTLAVGSSILFIGKKYKKEKGWSFKAVQVN